MACGTGKTFTTLWIKEQLQVNTTLVLLPSLNLLGQTMREWTAAFNQPFDVLCVCSDKSVGRKSEDMGVNEAPFPVTSQPDEIEQFLKNEGPKVVFCTYQSSELIAEAQRHKSVPNFDLVVADEAHRFAGKADAAFSTVLDGEAIRATKRLFTTATPRMYASTLSTKAEERGVEIIGMARLYAFGPQLHTLTFGEAIKRDLLTDYQVVIVGVNEPMVKEWIDEGEIIAFQPDEATDARSLAAKIGLIKAIKDYDLKRVISFHSRVKGAQDFSAELSDIVALVDENHRPQGSIWTDFVSGEMSAGDRTTKIKKLKDLGSAGRGLLTNARCLSEGVDVPALDGVAFIDPKGSQVDIIQAVGRAIRKSDGKDKGTIVIPVFIEDGDDPEDQIEASNFKPVWDVLKALRAHDGVLADTLDKYRTNMAKNASQGRESISDKIILDIPVSVDVEFSHALRTVLVEASTSSWEFWFGLLEVFKDREGHCKVPTRHKDGAYNLGNWVATQRRREMSLPPDQFNRLETLGFVLNPQGEAWEEGFSKLQQFHSKEGHCKAPTTHKEDGYPLGQWMTVQRSSKEILSPERFNRLEALGFVWSPHEAAWEEGFSKLQTFRTREGHCRVPSTHREDSYGLGQWVVSQRSNKVSLPPERIERLEALGFVWSELTAVWEEGFQKLQQFHSREGHCTVPNKHREDGFRLGSWVTNKRTNKNKLPPEWLKQLEALGFVWNKYADEWEEGFNKLQSFHFREGHSRVSQSYNENGFRLGQWVSNQRARKARLPPERIELIDALGFIWDCLEAAWEEGFNKLLQFHCREGHCMAPRGHKEGDFMLGTWVGIQRNNKANLSPDRLERLEAHGFAWDPHSVAWEIGFSKLLQFHSREGHSKVAGTHKEDGYRLGQWAGVQRINKESLSSERLEQLEALGFVWNLREAAWEEGLSYLQSFKEREDHCKVPISHKEDDFKLGFWVSNQRVKKDTLSPERLERLEALGFVWDTRTAGS
jgi:superfamily II DNA or RNA helicase